MNIGCPLSTLQNLYKLSQIFYNIMIFVWKILKCITCFGNFHVRAGQKEKIETAKKFHCRSFRVSTKYVVRETTIYRTFATRNYEIPKKKYYCPLSPILWIYLIHSKVYSVKWHLEVIFQIIWNCS